MHELQSFLDKRFKRNMRQTLGSLVRSIKRGTTIPKGNLVIMASGDAQLRLKILDQDTPHREFSTPLVINDEGIALGISPNYLHWFLSQDPVTEHLIRFATGSVILRVPLARIHSLPIPIPLRPLERTGTEEVVLRKEDDLFRKRLDSCYQDYLLNVKHKRFRTAIILAGAISEAILYQLLLDEGVERKLLDRDRSLGLGRLITYLKLLKLDKSLNLPMSHFRDIQKKRNNAVHFGSGSAESISFSRVDLDCFDHVIKHFGI